MAGPRDTGNRITEAKRSGETTREERIKTTESLEKLRVPVISEKQSVVADGQGTHV